VHKTSPEDRYADREPRSSRRPPPPNARPATPAGAAPIPTRKGTEPEMSVLMPGVPAATVVSRPFVRYQDLNTERARSAESPAPAPGRGVGPLG